MTKPIHVLNGPNLNRLGTREPEIYGRTTLAEIQALCRAVAPDVVFRQSNREDEIIEWVHEAVDAAAGIIINPAAFTFTSMAIMDALKMFPGPIIELHISNIHRREPIYHSSYVSAVATAVIAGLGPSGYATAVMAMRDLVARAAAGSAVVDPGSPFAIKAASAEAAPRQATGPGRPSDPGSRTGA